MIEEIIAAQRTVVPDLSQESVQQDILPVLPIKNLVILPSSIIPIIVGRKSSIYAVEQAVKNHQKTIFITAQKNPETESPTGHELFEHGTKSTIVQVIKMNNGSLKVLIEGVCRSKMVETYQSDLYTSALIQDSLTTFKESAQMHAAWRSLKHAYTIYCKHNPKAPTDLFSLVESIDDHDTITDTIAVHINLSFLDRQRILETANLYDRMILLTVLIRQEIEIVQTEERIKGRVQNQVEKNQKEYYLNEQLKAIQKELGRDDHSIEIDSLRHKIKHLSLPKNVAEKVERELNRLDQMPGISTESAISKHYIDWIIHLPWTKKSKDTISMVQAEAIMNKEHAGLQKIKDRILEFVAAQKYSQELQRTPTICLVGPPGVGKTSLARSIAKILGKEFTRISLGGVKDEAEIRGHRRTYIGALPGKILHAMRKTKTINPVILLDEIDKLAHDITGDPAAALLEVLDPEQNKTFTDHFIDTEYDLSTVMFIATANSIDNIPHALYDRMEIINIAGYTEQEKISIAQDFLIPRNLKEHAIKKSQIKIQNSIISSIIQDYTKEAGVRQLDRVFAKIMRKSIQAFLKDDTKKTISLTPELLTQWLGSDTFKKTELCKQQDIIGIGTGLAWTELGGDVLEIEISIMPGKGNLTLTGQLGEIMQESAQTAHSYVRSRATKMGIAKNVFTNNDIHIHFPDGATPKDGSSAGITISSALVSALTSIPFKNHIAMTGEVTLRGRVLAIGGLKEKLLAAQQHGIKTVIIPKANETDLLEFKKDIDKLTIIFADQMDLVLEHVLTKNPFKYKKRMATKRKKKSLKK